MTRSVAAAAVVAALLATGIAYASAASRSVAQAAPAAQQLPPPAQAPNDGMPKESGERAIHINERSYSTDPGDCITVISGLASSLNIRNDSGKTVEVFRGAVCDNGAPIAHVGPHSSSNGVTPQPTDAITIDNGVVGSFRVIPATS